MCGLMQERMMDRPLFRKLLAVVRVQCAKGGKQKEWFRAGGGLEVLKKGEEAHKRLEELVEAVKETYAFVGES